MPELTILTPSFNRKPRMKKLLESLEQQTIFDFQWLIIDDGSTDGTKEWFDQLDKASYSFKIDYYYKKNGGKHTALNYSHQFIKGKYIVIVDSDDRLVDKAVETILTYWRKYESDSQIGGITFQRGELRNHRKFDDKIVGVKESTFSAMTNEGMSGDHCETFRTSLFRQRNFPVFRDEKFLAEAAMWYFITRNYHVIYVDDVVYLAEYLDGGLTKSGRSLRISNPRGSRWHARAFLNSDFNFRIRIKNSLLFNTYSHFIGENYFKAVSTTTNSRFILTINWLPSYGLYYIWKKKYGN